MNEKVLHTLEYNKILDQLTEYAFSADAKSRCQKLRPITFDPVHNTYREIGSIVGKAFSDGLKLK